MFGGGGGGFDPSQLQQMMQQFGIDMTELDATRVTIETADGERLVFDAPDVTRMDAQGQQTYQIVGDPTTEATADEPAADTAASEAIPEDDVTLVASRTGASAEDARAALEDTDGDLAAAIASLE